MNNKRTYTYDPELATMVIDNIYITGFAEDGKIEAEKNENNINPKVGVDGIVHLSKSADKTGTIKLKLMSTSPSLPYIRDLARNQQKFNFSLIDMNEVGQNIVSDNCVILKDADIILAEEAEAVEIEIFVPYMY